jgi:hypothetical protein
MEADEVFHNRHSTQQCCADTEDSVCRQLISRQAIPHAKVQADGHANAVEEDQGPEPKDGLLPRAQRVFERRRAPEVGVIVRDLSMWVDGMRVGRWSSTRIRASIQGCRGATNGCCAARLSFIVVAGAIDLNSGHVKGIRLRCRRACVCFSRCYGPQRLCGSLLGRHCAVVIMVVGAAQA